MKDSPLIIPDSDFIQSFTQDKTTLSKEQQSPTRVDAHVDLPYFMMSHGIGKPFSELSEAPFTLTKAKAANIRLFCTAIYCEDSYNGPGAENRYQEILDFAISRLDSLTLIKTREELGSVRESPADRLFTVLLLENGDFLADDPRDNISRLREDGVRIVSLTHMGRNRLADGNAVDIAEGITDEGKEVVRILSEKNIIVDTAHLHPKCFWQLIDLTDRPVVCTHTGIQEVYKIPRNLNLEQISSITERGGIIGLSLNPEMLGSHMKLGVETVFAHLDTVVQKFGPSSVGIGSDLGGFNSAPEELLGPEALIRLEDLMERHGYGRQAIAAIMGGNWLHFLELNM